MAIGGAFLGGGVEVVPAGSCKLELEILTEDRANLTATFTIKGASTYTVTAGADGRAVYTVPSGQTYTVSVNTTGYDNLASQTVVAESGTVRYVRFEAFAGRVKRSGDTMTGELKIYGNSAFTTLINTKANEFTKFIHLDNTSGSTEWVGVTQAKKWGTNGSQVELIALDRKTNVWKGIYIQNDNGTCIISGVTPSDKADNSTKIATTGWVNQSDFLVHRYGNEVVAGEKKFTSKLYANGNLDMWSSLVIGTAPSSTLKKTIAIKDSAGAWYGEISSAVDKYGTTAVFLRTRKWNSSENTFADLGVNLLSDGTKYAVAPTTPTDATGNQIATADWSIGKFVKKSGDTMTGIFKIAPASGTPKTNLIHPNFEMSTIPTANCFWDYELCDKNGKRFGMVEGLGSKDSSARQIGFCLNISADPNTESWQRMLLINDDSYGSYAIAPTPTNKSSNSTAIATTAWINSADVICRTVGNQTIGGEKTFTSPIVDPQNQSGVVRTPNSNASASPYYRVASCPISTVNTYDRVSFTFDVVAERFGDSIVYGTIQANFETDKNKAIISSAIAVINKTSTPSLVTNTENWFLVYNATENQIQIWCKVTSDQYAIRMRTRYTGRRYSNNSPWRFLEESTGQASLPEGWTVTNCVDMSNKLAESTDSGATGKEIATADWVNTKVATKNGLTEFTSWEELEALLKAGKRGDSFNVTMDFSGFTTIIDAIELSATVHAYGHYFVDDITVSGGEITDAEMFGSGEIQFETDGATKTFATTGFGRKKVISNLVWGFRTPSNGNMGYAVINNDGVTSCSGYYISI